MRTPPPAPRESPHRLPLRVVEEAQPGGSSGVLTGSLGRSEIEDSLKKAHVNLRW
jgi:hypothetical protein